MEVVVGDARSLPLAAGSVQCCVTSPPYWGLRDYGVAGQLGLESTPDEYVAGMVGVFREVWRVLRDDGTLWLNLGDSYARQGGRVSDQPRHWDGRENSPGSMHGTRIASDFGSKPKDLVGIPWRVAFALQADGWYLRQDIIWAKPNPMPESVRDRCTKAHEYMFLLTKKQKYYYDADAVAEPGLALRERIRPNGIGNQQNKSAPLGFDNSCGADGTRNRRSVWTVNTQPYAEAHFATFPEKLVEPCVLAGSRPAGRRCDCDEVIASPTGTGAIDDPTLETGRAGMNRPRRADEGTRPVTRRQQREWARQIINSPNAAEMEREAGIETFAHYIRTDRSGARPPRPDLLELWLSRGWLGPTTPCDCPEQPADLVLDPFAGSGTVGVVCRKLARRFVGVELNPKYVDLARARMARAQPGLALAV